MKDNLVNIKETSIDKSDQDHDYQQIVEFFKPDQLDHLDSLTSPSEKAQFILKNEAFQVGSSFRE